MFLSRTSCFVRQYSRLAHPVLAPSLTGYFFSHSQCLVIWSQKTWGSPGSQVASHGAPKNDPNSVKQMVILYCERASSSLGYLLK
jgi:hypothetical protein